MNFQVFFPGMSFGSGFSFSWRTFGPYHPWTVRTDDGKQLFASARGYSVKMELGPIWSRFLGGPQMRFDSGILNEICKSDVKMRKMRKSPTLCFCEEKCGKVAVWQTTVLTPKSAQMLCTQWLFYDFCKPDMKTCDMKK